MALKEKYDVVIIGAGPGGLAASIAAKQNGAEDVLSSNAIRNWVEF